MYKLQWIKDKFNKLHYKKIKILCKSDNLIYIKRQKDDPKIFFVNGKGYNMITNWKQNGYSEKDKNPQITQIRQKIDFLSGKFHNIWRKAPP